MARLTSKARMALPKSDYGLPSKKPKSGSYPIPDANHGRLALAMASKYASPEEKAEIRAKVRAKFPGIKVKDEKEK